MTMTTATLGTGIAQWLIQLSNEIGIPQQDIDCLHSDHGICDPQDLVTKKDSLRNMELVGVSEHTQQKLRIAAVYIESKGSNTPDPLANFTKTWGKFLLD